MNSLLRFTCLVDQDGERPSFIIAELIQQHKGPSNVYGTPDLNGWIIFTHQYLNNIRKLLRRATV